MNTITVYHLPWGVNYQKERETWFTDRTEYISFRTKLEGEAAAEEAFHITNAPEELLTEEQKQLAENFKGPSLSVGDIVQVAPVVVGPNCPLPEYYLCRSFGWEKFVGDTIQLLKYMSW
jgi:hypothetical protein